jgi:hypothetical protein
MPPFKPDEDGVLQWWEPQDWAAEKAKRKVMNQKAFRVAQREVKPDLPLDTKEGQKQRVELFKKKLLTDENGNAVIQKVMAVALDDEHPGQMAALKMCLDRMLPLGLFEEKKNPTDRPAISINITGIGEVQPKLIEGETYDG